MNQAEREIRRRLTALQDLSYKEFQCRLMPNVDPQKVIGVRMPQLRRLAKEIMQNDPDLAEDFLSDLPHPYYDEDNMHGVILCGRNDFAQCIAEIERFLPYIDNWATCDMIKPKTFEKHRDQLLPHIELWIASDHTYTIRFGIKMLMDYYLKENFEICYADMVAGVRSEAYYVNMMIAWYFATALAYQYEAVLPYIEEPRLDPWTQNKAIQKAIESCRITPAQKAYLKTLKREKEGKAKCF
ncbi:MAG: DNA alkylation repair protein [Firmicutes bacterium]|nr:DNA alkylation repair protein [Bacillota bacterium]MDD7601867.1 DNA alkylation repair protein [Bacillota bacterium]MDY5855883.1 DNA alkylation repair protein [Anaerovoracaceae bacterium]